jgi:hypothetical protein
MKRFRAGKAGFTDKAHLKAKGLIPRADGTKKKSPQYESADTRELTNLLNKRTPLTPAEQKRKAELEKKLGVNEAKSNQEKIAIDTVKNPNKSLLGGPTASEAEKMLRTKFGYTDKQIAKLKEDAPANATGTAVAGTGDDSSTVVVKRKKDKEKMKDRLLRRFKIRETIDRLVPAIEPPTDEVRERVNQLKELAKKEEGFASDAQRRAAFASGYKAKGKKKNKKEMAAAAAGASTGMKKKEEVEEGLTGAAAGAVIGGLTAGVPGAAAGAYLGHKIQQAAKKNKKSKKEDMDRQPQDKDVKKVKGTQPKKYYKTLDKDTKKKRADFFKTRKPYSKSDDDDDYKAAPGDAKAKTKPSGFTKKFKQMYGEVKDINETIKAVQNKAKKTGMPYSILKQVYNRGMAAWKGGHRPGATQQQWALARVNSFVTKSSGTWGGADKDLAKKVRAAKK